MTTAAPTLCGASRRMATLAQPRNPLWQQQCTRQPQVGTASAVCFFFSSASAIAFFSASRSAIFFFSRLASSASSSFAALSLDRMPCAHAQPCDTAVVVVPVLPSSASSSFATLSLDRLPCVRLKLCYTVLVAVLRLLSYDWDQGWRQPPAHCTSWPSRARTQHQGRHIRVHGALTAAGAPGLLGGRAL